MAPSGRDVQEAIVDDEMVLPFLHLLLSCHFLMLGKYLWLLWGVGFGSALNNGCFKPLHNFGVKVGALQV